jgi:hypothetical protein
MTQRQQGSSDDDAATPRADRVADAQGEHELDRTSAQQAVINEEEAFESGEENPS